MYFICRRKWRAFRVLCSIQKTFLQNKNSLWQTYFRNIITFPPNSSKGWSKAELTPFGYPACYRSSSRDNTCSFNHRVQKPAVWKAVWLLLKDMPLLPIQLLSMEPKFLGHHLEVAYFKGALVCSPQGIGPEKSSIKNLSGKELISQ